MRRREWSDVPIALGAALLAAGGLLLAAQLLQITPGRPMKLSAALIGVTSSEPVPLSWADVVSGRTQATVSRQVGLAEPYYATAIRLRNQIEYSLLGYSAEQTIVVGAGDQLIERVYIDEYCSRDLAAFLRQAPAWATSVRRIQDAVERRGQVFLYVVTPSKVAQYPGYLPPSLPCPSKQADRIDTVASWMALLRQQGVHAVDTTATLWAAHGAYPFELFPRGGTHWNAVGSTLALQAIDAGLLAQHHDQAFAPFSFSWRISSHPADQDIDLARLLNLFRLPDHFTVPVVTVDGPPPGGCSRRRITIVGGSFMEAIAASLSRSACVGRVVEYFYWHERFAWSNGARTRSPADRALRDAELRDADIILLEQNEAGLRRGEHAEAYQAWLGVPDEPARTLRYPTRPHPSPAPG